MAKIDSDIPLLVGKPHIRLESVNSTNRYAIELVSKNSLTEGTVISTSHQFAGKGQIGKFWESEKGKNITCSTIFLPQSFPVSDQYYLNIAIALAVHDFVEHFIPSKSVKIKWPNDIYVDHKKIAGILIQNALKGKFIDSVIVGTGININQTKFCSEVPNPTSVALENEYQEQDLENMFLWLFRFLQKRYLLIKANRFQSLSEEYHSHLYRKNEIHSYELPDGKRFEGMITGVSSDGRLSIKTNDDKILQFSNGEISYCI